MDRREGPIRIPPSTWYKPGRKHVEDIPGYALCQYCRHCAMNHLGQIEDDGAWYCFFFQKWYRGDEILTYRCRGFRRKDCTFCKTMFCKDRNPKGVDRNYGWCNNYCDKLYSTPVLYYVGRPRNRIAYITNPEAKQMEKDFMAWKESQLKEENAREDVHPSAREQQGASDHTADGSTQKGESEEAEAGS